MNKFILNLVTYLVFTLNLILWKKDKFTSDFGIPYICLNFVY